MILPIITKKETEKLSLIKVKLLTFAATGLPKLTFLIQVMYFKYSNDGSR